ncbi:MAG: hypothetical protein ABMB14_11500 [Myxococcota bacterium]
MRRMALAGLASVTVSTCPERRDEALPEALPDAVPEALPAAAPRASDPDTVVGPGSRERFDPAPLQVPAGPGEVLFGGGGWASTTATALRPRHDGGWSSWGLAFDAWQAWDPASGWVGPDPAGGARPMFGCGTGAADQRRDELRTHRERAAQPDRSAPDRACIGAGWVSGTRRLCEVDDGVALFDGVDEIARWDATSRRPVVDDAVWSPDGTQVAWTDPARIVSWRADGPGWAVDRTAWHPIFTRDGTLVVASTRDGFAVHDARDGRRLDRDAPGVPFRAVLGPSGEVAAATPDGALCVEASGQATCYDPGGAVRSRRSLAAHLFAVGAHDLASGPDGLAIDGRAAIPDARFWRVDPSGERIGIRRDGAPFVVDLGSGTVRPGDLDDVIRSPTEVIRGGRALSVRPDGAVVVRPAAPRAETAPR